MDKITRTGGGEMEKPKPCPFCGSDDIDTIFDAGWRKHSVFCPKCWGSISGQNNKEYAIKAWNTRTPPEEGE
jgi:Lar family restriction alleviation protein